jgi:cytochrome c-type biogenesis protein
MRGRLLNAGKVGKQVFGLVMLGFGILILTGLDKALEGWILDRTPDWLKAVTTRF